MIVGSAVGIAIDGVVASYTGKLEIDNLESAALPNKRKVIEALEHLKSALFVGFYATRTLHRDNLRQVIAEHLYAAHHILVDQIERALSYDHWMGRTEKPLPAGSGEDVVLSLLCLHDVNLGIKTEKFVETSKFVMDFAKVQQPPNRPIVGDKLYEVESGIIAGWVRLCRAEHPLEYVPFAPELVGQKPVNIVLGKNSGPPSIEEGAEKTGIKITDEERMALLLAVKAKSFEKKDLLTAEEFKEIVGKTLKNAALA